MVGNLTRGPDGRWTALDARHLYRHAKTAGFLYQAVLRREVSERLGLQWQPVERGVADVVGVPREVIEHFSQRRAKILEHSAEHGGRSAHALQVAALETRRAKQHVPVDRLREVDHAPRSVELELDGGKRVSLDSAYLAAGHLDHGYAVTAHRAQGATVDNTFVLGSDELYREWGYTALSRHRDQARFYVTRADLGLDRDAAPEPDPIIRGIERLLNRSHAKQLALDGLPEADGDQLSSERDKLRTLFEDDPPPRWQPELDHELKRTSEALDAARARHAYLEAERNGLPWYRRRERTELGRLLERQGHSVKQRSQLHEQALTQHSAAHTAQSEWLHRNGPDAERFLALDAELRARDAITQDAVRRLDEFHHAPEPLGRGLEPPVHELGLDMDMSR